MSSPAAIDSLDDPTAEAPDSAELVSDFYISRSGKIHGPCTLEEIRSYLAYASMSPADLVCRAGSDVWQQVQTLPELQPPPPEPHLFERAPEWPWLQNFLEKIRPAWDWVQERLPKKEVDPLAITPRRRAVRYRDYGKVPQAQRAGPTVSKLFWGFLFFPPRLWSACASVFSQRIYRNKADANGYLRVWPRWVEAFCAVLVIINAFIWMFFLYWLVDFAFPTASAAFRDIWREVKELVPEGLLKASSGQL